MMKVIITGGGTAGHITPLLAVAAEFKKRHPEAHIRYIGQVADPMSHLLLDVGDVEKAYTILAGKWRRYHGVGFWKHLTDIKTVFKNLRDVFFVLIGIVQSTIILLIWRPNIVFVKGGFVGLPVGLAAALLRITLVTHDSDSIPGLTNRVLSRFSKLQAVAMPASAYSEYYPVDKLRFSGVPVRQEFTFTDEQGTIEAKHKLNINEDGVVLLVIGGSLGAVRLNEAVLSSFNMFMAVKNLHLFWVCGKRQHQELIDRLSSWPNDGRLRLIDFTDNLDVLIKASDLVVTRAGATAIAELAAVAKPIIIVPNPILTGGHQSKNARILAESSAAVVLTEDQISKEGQLLASTVTDLLADESKRQMLSANLHTLAVGDAAGNLVFILEEAMQNDI